LADDTKLYEDWYHAFYAPDSDTETVAFAPSFSLETFKKRFNQWFEKRRNLLRHKICEEWGYPQKKSVFENAMIIAISVDCLAVALSLPTTNVITVGTILVVDGYLDKLCPEA